ncbi:class I SAM-dependent methyltransferase [Sphingomonas crocodyli]|uniref:SAM-dependent methyltransferase n=1 Tax=Sphingomonas crocodyli TaxID=1979270 RepID=A0A437LXQ7_9SPHN|nr:SAM-dependent methyltransferase [Sphingomonas crocodyli]
MRENENFATTISPGSLVLDAGAGDQPYRHCFSHCTYEAADFEKVDKPYAKSTYVCDLSSIPVADARFDAIVFNQVMEHLSDPLTVLKELRRVLKPGGRMICTAPLFYEEHEVPYDFYRYTQFGWRHLLAKAGFEIEKIGWMEGYLGTVAYQLQTAARYLPIRPRDIAPGGLGYVALPAVALTKFASHLCARLFYRLDEKHRYTAKGFPKNYVLTVR